MKLSVIVPVYNVSKYLSKCLDSILNQDIERDDYEIIVVNDGSTDNSGEIAQEYADIHFNIQLINQENQGLSGARNTGIMAARGEYIQFVDSDDYLEPNVLSSLIERIQSDQLDVLRFNYQNVNENYEIFEPNKESRPYMDYSETICNGAEFLNERLGYACYAWQFLLRTDLVKDCLFKEHILFEDTQWTPRMLRKAQRVSSTSEIIYYYLSRNGSITKAKGIDKQRVIIESKLSLIADLQNQMLSCSDKRWYGGMISVTAISALGHIVEYLFSERKTYIGRMKQNNVFPLSAYHLSKAASRKRMLINASPLLFCLILKMSK